MAVLEQNPIASSTANGATTVFPHAFKVLEADDLLVRGLLAGAYTTFVLGVDYTVSGLGADSGAVTFLTAPPSGMVITRTRRTRRRRLTDYQNNGDLPAATLNRDLDRLVMMAQEAAAAAQTPDTPTDALRFDLADNSAGTKGAGMVGFGSAVNYAAGSVGAFLRSLTTAGASIGSALLGFLQAGVDAVARTVQSKLREHVTFDDFGAVGDGTTDDTASIQKALNTSARRVSAVAGKTYLVDGDLNSYQASRVISVHGATIKLKNNATSKFVLNCWGARTRVEGGEWDGNRTNGNSPVDTYTSYAVMLLGDRSTVRDTVVRDFGGIGLKGLGNYLRFEDNDISGTTHYGVFIDGAPGVSYRGNRAVGNTIDMSAAGAIGQAVLFTAASGQAQTDYLIADNDVIGPQDVGIADQAINLAVRGNDGVVANNTTRYGSMGWSEGGNNCVVTGNRFLQLRGTVRIGIEPSGKFTASNNIVTDAYVGVDCTAAGASFDGSVVEGGTLALASGGSLIAGVRFQATGGTTARRCSVAGVNISAPVTGAVGVYLAGQCAGTVIVPGTWVGPGVGSGRGVFLDTLVQPSNVFIIGGLMDGWQRPWEAYSAGSLTYTDLQVDGVKTVNVGSTATTWPVAGSATIGARCAVLGADGGALDVFDVQANVFNWSSAAFNNPEGALAAGVGSIFASRANGNVYRKSSGSGNTGWVAM